ncbi:MAG TPA: starch-binding protein [Caproicibacter sp.]|nr:starch-binding protein [Caproicibacter sp.]
MKKHFSKVISWFLALIVMVVSAGAVIPANAASNTVTIYFKDNQGWGNACYYAFEADTNAAVSKSWPGSGMTSIGGNWYKATITTTKTINAVFNNGGTPAKQTADVKGMNPGGTYYFIPGSGTTKNAAGIGGVQITMSTAKPADFPAESAAGTSSSKASISTSLPTATKDATPQTGDNNPVTVIGIVGIVSLAGAWLLLGRKRLVD